MPRNRRPAPSVTLEALRRYESPNVTFQSADGAWPIVWTRARDCHVRDENGRRYLDLTAAFGVANAGHAHPVVLRAARHQMRRLLHAMGDVHPHPRKAELVRQLSRLTFERWSRRQPPRLTGRTILCNSGFEAVEAALKTARLATGRPGVVAFEQAYHGLGYGTLNVTSRADFREPFRDQLTEFGTFLPYPTAPQELPLLAARLKRLATRRIGAILVEPVQGRGGFRVPPPGFLRLLRETCEARGWLLIADEIYTGFGRTGQWFACESERVIPDVICLGKALTGGFPLSACVGRADLMERAWPPSTGEAIHTSTFLGHPVGCAMALAQMEVLKKEGLPRRARKLGRRLAEALTRLTPPRGYTLEVRGRGLMMGLEVRHADGTPAGDLVVATVTRLLEEGLILLPEGPHGNVLAWAPPLSILEKDLLRSVKTAGRVLIETAESFH